MIQAIYRAARIALTSAQQQVILLNRTDDFTFSVRAWREFLKAFAQIANLLDPDGISDADEREWANNIAIEISGDDLLNFLMVSSKTEFSDEREIASDFSGVTFTIEDYDGTVREYDLDPLYAKERNYGMALDFMTTKLIGHQQNKHRIRAVPLKYSAGELPIPTSFFEKTIPNNPPLSMLASLAISYLDSVMKSALCFGIRTYIR